MTRFQRLSLPWNAFFFFFKLHRSEKRHSFTIKDLSQLIAQAKFTNINYHDIPEFLTRIDSLTLFLKSQQ